MDATLGTLILLATQTDPFHWRRSQTLRLSLVETDYVPRALVERGLAKVRNGRRAGRKPAHAYVRTPAGLVEKMCLPWAMHSQKKAEFDALHQTTATQTAEVGEKAGK